MLTGYSHAPHRRSLRQRPLALINISSTLKRRAVFPGPASGPQRNLQEDGVQAAMGRRAVSQARAEAPNRRVIRVDLTRRRRKDVVPDRPAIDASRRRGLPLVHLITW